LTLKIRSAFLIIGGDELKYTRLLQRAFLSFFLCLAIVVFTSSCVGVLLTYEEVSGEAYVSVSSIEPVFTPPPPPAHQVVSPATEESVDSEEMVEMVESEEAEDDSVEPDVAQGYVNANPSGALGDDNVFAETDPNPLPLREYEVAAHYDCGFADCGVCEVLTEVPPVAELPAPGTGTDRRPRLALTFDDGPGPYTVPILRILEANNSRATFCVIGRSVENSPEVVSRTHNGGHEVIGHSWNHANLTLLSRESIERQILDTSAAIEAATGVAPPPIFRAPYGAVNARVRSTASDLGYSILNWSVDTNDWRYRDVDHIYNHIMERAVDGAIILLHDIHETTYRAMRRVIPSLVERGFELVTAGEIIAQVYGSLVPGEEYRGRR